MSKITAQNIKDLGWIPEQFKGQNTGTFDAFLTAIITEVSGILSGLIGSSLYASTDPTVLPFVTRAERCLTEAELWRRRIVAKDSFAISGGDDNKWSEHQSFDGLIDEANSIINRLSDGDFASGATVSGHMDSDND